MRPSGLAPCNGDQLDDPLRFSCTTWLADAGRAVVIVANAAAAAETRTGRSILSEMRLVILEALEVESSGSAFLLCTAGHTVSSFRHVPELVVIVLCATYWQTHAATPIYTLVFYDQVVPGTRRREQEIFRNLCYYRKTWLSSPKRSNVPDSHRPE